jgi:hypothetical protein
MSATSLQRAIIAGYLSIRPFHKRRDSSRLSIAAREEPPAQVRARLRDGAIIHIRHLARSIEQFAKLRLFGAAAD